jgi:hypothetical protein
MSGMIPSKKAGAYFLTAYLCVLALSILALIMLPADRRTLRLIAGVFAYGTGLPVAVTFALHLLESKGWLKERAEKRKTAPRP